MSEMLLTDALGQHLKTIAERDLTGFEKTIVPDGRLRVILPNGRILQGHDEVMAFHKNWFSDPDWSMVVERQESWATADMGYVLCQVTYNDLDEEGQPYALRYWLTLTFVYEHGQWLLIHDQNTLF